MKVRGFNRGLVCDEFGSCVGIVTLKDLMEGLVGVVNDYDDLQEPQIIKRSNKDEWLVDGQCPIHELLQHFDMEEFYEVDESYTTIAGLCLEILEHIPSAGEKITWNSLEIEIADMDGARIDKVLVTLNSK
jgi:putative hemolysin